MSPREEAMARIRHILLRVGGRFAAGYRAYGVVLTTPGAPARQVDAIIADVARTWADRPDLSAGFSD